MQSWDASVCCKTMLMVVWNVEAHSLVREPQRSGLIPQNKVKCLSTYARISLIIHHTIIPSSYFIIIFNIHV